MWEGQARPGQQDLVHTDEPAKQSNERGLTPSAVSLLRVTAAVGFVPLCNNIREAVEVLQTSPEQRRDGMSCRNAGKMPARLSLQPRNDSSRADGGLGTGH